MKEKNYRYELGCFVLNLLIGIVLIFTLFGAKLMFITLYKPLVILMGISLLTYCVYYVFHTIKKGNK